jgi:NAD(P)-dependent dehydrogenase (short-subunit alcohol dehydrogenase family)
MEASMGRLAGKTAVITGGSTRIGLASAKRFAAEGASVYFLGRRQATARRRRQGNRRGGVKDIQGDISKPEDLNRLFAAVSADTGSLDILFANPGLGILAPQHRAH